jgi:hypothetical protein
MRATLHALLQEGIASLTDADFIGSFESCLNSLIKPNFSAPLINAHKARAVHRPHK